MTSVRRVRSSSTILLTLCLLSRPGARQTMGPSTFLTRWLSKRTTLKPGWTMSCTSCKVVPMARGAGGVARACAAAPTEQQDFVTRWMPLRFLLSPNTLACSDAIGTPPLSPRAHARTSHTRSYHTRTCYPVHTRARARARTHTHTHICTRTYIHRCRVMDTINVIQKPRLSVHYACVRGVDVRPSLLL